MPDHTTENVAKDRLTASRTALMQDMGVTSPTSSSRPSQTGHAFDTPMKIAQQPAVRASMWQMLSHKALKAWWARHPANTALQLAQPTLQSYASKHPAAVIGGGAVLGSALYILRPWRLLSIGTLVMLVVRGPALPRNIFGLLRKTGALGTLNRHKGQSLTSP
jgi:hypothetical protein